MASSTTIPPAAPDRFDLGSTLPRQRHHSEQQRRLQSDVISLLRSLPKAQAREMLQQLRDNADLPTVLSSMQGSADSMMRPSDLRTARAILPPTGSAIEFELRAQNNTAHPKVLPVNISSLMGLLQRRNNDRMRSALSNAPNTLPSVFQSNSDCLQFTKPRHSSASSQVLVPRPFLSGQYCDSRLEKLRISYWTKVPVSNKLAATLISFDIETDHKIMGFFGADVFLEDLVECRQIFCSSFLVNAVLCLACYHVSCRRGHDISPVHRNTSDSHPKAIYAASINQLKDLVFSYRANYPEASFTSYFNPRLFTLSLALLEDLQDPLWRYYFYICVRCWQDLYFCYPVFRDVTKAFLSMAMQKDAIPARETQELLQEIQQSAQQSAAANEAFTSFIFDPVFSITSEAQVHAMADRFEEMVLFNEFIERDFT
ncbi:hypothetical protein FOYG_11846 [Fusarium oxysporum NRRL 32931]|uniref:Uncharacterized protein n=1 Tax=Fusarium oxysporum NRRL 32931 TaxID=660029 RepID=W9HVZ5_FUSOX|nr:hypothetical protein FOYG_11846 [Fusarium oxysporum NRRL 32931]